MDSLRPPDSENELLDLTIRFSASIPDLLLTIQNPSTATTSTLKQQIRKHLPAEYTDRRIRLIFAGKALIDNATLSSALLKRPHSRTPSRASTPLPPPTTSDADNNNNGSATAPNSSSSAASKAKGKLPIRDPPAASRLYIHCSIGDVVLSAADLANEAALARRPSPSDSQNTLSFDAENGATDNKASTSSTTTTTPMPRGFDRLLSAGFTPSEILTLRSQFLAIQAHTHTPDTMPSPTTLRDLEDQWLDNSDAATASGGTSGIGAGAGAGMDEEGAAGALDDLLWGSVMGFFWPVGCLWWACREEGIWSRRRKMAVIVGVLVNAGFGCLRWMR